MESNSKRIQEEGGPKRKRIRRKETCDSPSNDQNRSFDQLPDDVLRSILELVSFKDLDRAKDVSSFWKSVAEPLLKKRQYLHGIKSLWFINHDNSIPVPVSPFVITNDVEHKTYPLSKATSDLFLQCPYIGSSRGWLIFMKHETLNPILFNPISETRIQLPTLKSYAGSVDKEVIWKNFILKAILTADPHHSNYGVVLIYNNHHLGKQRLGYYKNGKHRWRQLGGSLSKDGYLVYHHHILDILCYKSKLYTLHTDLYGLYTSIDIWDLQDCCLMKMKTFRTESFFMDNMGIRILRSVFNVPLTFCHDGVTLKVEGDCLKLYLVELGGEILLVSRFVENFEVVVCKLDLNKEQGGVRLFSLGGDKSLLLGRNQSMAISTKDQQWYKGNSIYFIHDAESSKQLDLYELCNQDGTWTNRCKSLKKTSFVDFLRPESSNFPNPC